MQFNAGPVIAATNVVTAPTAGNWRGTGLFVCRFALSGGKSITGVSDDQTGAVYHRVIRQASPDGLTAVEIWVGRGTNAANLGNITFTATDSGGGGVVLMRVDSVASDTLDAPLEVSGSGGGNSDVTTPAATATVKRVNDVVLAVAAFAFGSPPAWVQDADSVGGAWSPGSAQASATSAPVIGGVGQKAAVTAAGDQTYNPTLTGGSGKGQSAAAIIAVSALAKKLAMMV